MHTLKVITTLLALCAGGCASLESPQVLVSVPDKLKPGANEALSAVIPAKGVQIYECRARKEQPGNYAWTFVAPEADLFDGRGKRIGRHYAGPHWEADDGSKIVGALKERADAPAGDAIPWLLLTSKSVGREGVFRNITSIQRVNTAGGLPPLSGCSNAAIGTTTRIHYTADYYFFAAK
jgi:hypothetical protein